MTFYDDGFGVATEDAAVSTEGELRTRYFIHPRFNDGGSAALGAAVDALVTQAEAMGIKYGPLFPEDPMPLYTDGTGWTDDWDDDGPLTKEDARRMVEAFREQWADATSTTVPSDKD